MIVGEGIEGRFLIATPTKAGTTTLEYIAHRIQGGKRKPSLSKWRVYDEEKPRRQHRMALPPSDLWHSATRHLLVRNPYARYTSIYEYMRHPTNFSQWGTKSVQGREWKGTAHNPWALYAPMDFPAFMGWYAARRVESDSGRMRKRRVPLWMARAYRSPWVWTDSLLNSLEALEDQPCPERECVGSCGNPVHQVTLVRLENLFGEQGDLAALLRRHGVDPGFVIKPLHGNRTTLRHGSGSPVPAVKGDVDIWKSYYGGDSTLCAPDTLLRSTFGSGCDNVRSWGGPCPVCAMDVLGEALALGYFANATL